MRRAKPRRRLWLLAAAVVAVAIVAAVATVLATRGNRPAPPVAPVTHASTPSQQARNLEAWLKTNSR